MDRLKNFPHFLQRMIIPIIQADMPAMASESAFRLSAAYLPKHLTPKGA